MKSKAEVYIKKQIDSCAWIPGKVLPNAYEIAVKCNSTPLKVRNTLSILEKRKQIKKIKNIFVVCPKTTKEDILSTITSAKDNLFLARLFSMNGKIFGPYVIAKERNRILAFNTVSQKQIRATIFELQEALKFTSSLELLLTLHGEELEKAKRIYLKQMNLKELASVVFRRKKELAIQ